MANPIEYEVTFKCRFYRDDYLTDPVKEYRGTVLAWTELEAIEKVREDVWIEQGDRAHPFDINVRPINPANGG